MLGIDVKEALYDAMAGAKNTFLGQSATYRFFNAGYKRWQAKQKLQGPKTGKNTVDEYEFKKAIKSLKTEIGGTLNPLKWAWGLIQTILGNTKSERTVTNIQHLESYSHQHDAFRFVNDAQKCLITEIERRIANIESLGSKYLGTNNTKVTNDSVLKALKSALTSWLEPFDKIINGEVAEIAKISESDIKFLENMRDNIQYSPQARYIEDLLPKYNQIIIEAQRSLYNNPKAQPGARHRRAGQKLAKTAA